MDSCGASAFQLGATDTAAGDCGVAYSGFAVAAGAPLALVRSKDLAVRAGSVELFSYFALVTLAPMAGAFPVPLMGTGESSILGSWMGIGLLCGNQTDLPPETEHDSGR